MPHFVLFPVLVLCFLLPAIPTSAETIVRPSLGGGVGLRHARGDGFRLTQTNTLIAPELLLFDRLELSPAFRMTRTAADLRSIAGLPFDAKLTFPWQPSLGLRAGVRLYDGDLFRLTIAAEFETPLGRNRAVIDRFEPRGSLAREQRRIQDLLSGIPMASNAMSVLNDLLPGNPSLQHEWYEGTLTVGGRLSLGRFAPRLELGAIHAKHHLLFNSPPGLTALLDRVDVDIPERIGVTATLPYAMPGLDLDLGGGYVVSAQGLWIPAGVFTFWQTDVGIRVPLALP